MNVWSKSPVHLLEGTEVNLEHPLKVPVKLVQLLGILVTVTKLVHSLNAWSRLVQFSKYPSINVTFCILFLVTVLLLLNISSKLVTLPSSKKYTSTAFV